MGFSKVDSSLSFSAQKSYVVQYLLKTMNKSSMQFVQFHFLCTEPNANALNDFSKFPVPSKTQLMISSERSTKQTCPKRFRLFTVTSHQSSAAVLERFGDNHWKWMEYLVDLSLQTARYREASASLSDWIPDLKLYWPFVFLAADYLEEM